MTFAISVPGLEPKELDNRKASLILSEFARSITVSDVKAGKVFAHLATHVASLERFVTDAGPKLADVEEVVPVDEHDDALRQIVELEIENRVQRTVLDACFDRLAKGNTQDATTIVETPEPAPAPKKIKRSSSAKKPAKKS
jgi:hypothetical protein